MGKNYSSTTRHMKNNNQNRQSKGDSDYFTYMENKLRKQALYETWLMMSGTTQMGMLVDQRSTFAITVDIQSAIKEIESRRLYHYSYNYIRLLNETWLEEHNNEVTFRNLIISCELNKIRMSFENGSLIEQIARTSQDMLHSLGKNTYSIPTLLLPLTYREITLAPPLHLLYPMHIIDISDRFYKFINIIREQYYETLMKNLMDDLRNDLRNDTIIFTNIPRAESILSQSDGFHLGTLYIGNKVTGKYPSSTGKTRFYRGMTTPWN